jgi:hypothetical protein
MKYIITEDQLEKVKDKILKVSFNVFDNEWNTLQEFLNRRGNPPYIITDNVSLYGNKEIKSLGNLISVEGYLVLTRTSIESLGNLTSVKGYLDLRYTPISKKYSRKEIRDMVEVGGDIYS